MRLTKSEENRLLSEAILALISFVMVVVVIGFTGNYLVRKIVGEKEAIIATNGNLLTTNRRDAKESKFLRENQSAIETMWATLKGWGTGVSLPSLGALTQAGVADSTPLPTTKVPGNPTEYSGLKLFGDKTEFQRLLDAMATVETQQGLLQVRSSLLQLPPNIVPNGEKPTYLNIQLELVAPITK